MSVKKCSLEIEGRAPVLAYPGPLFIEILNIEGIDLHNDCGGNGKCGKCRIVFHSAPPEPLNGDRRHLSEAALSEGTRLACFHQFLGDCRIAVPTPAAVDWMD